MWKTVPVIVVITKSYSVPERVENIEMVKEAFAAPEGITELIDKTNVLMPEGIRAGAHDVYKFKLKEKKSCSKYRYSFNYSSSNSRSYSYSNC